jgi:HD-like signal output (HDOD) protein
LSVIQRAISTSPSFPAFAANVQELLAIKDNPYNTVNTVSAIILRDLSLTTQILKVVNSIYYQTHPRQVHTVSSAVMVLGFDRIRDLAVGLRLFENFRKSSHLSHIKQLIVHSFFTAIQAQEMAQADPLLQAEEVFITGLLFNIGELIVAFYLPRQYQQILDREKGGESKSSAAKEVLEASMEDVGLAILKDWNLPASMVKRLTFMHSGGSPGTGPEGRLRKMIKNAFSLTKTFLDPQMEPEERRAREEKACNSLGLNSEALGQSLTVSKKRLFEMTQILRIDLHKMPLAEAVKPKEKAEPTPLELAPDLEAGAAGTVPRDSKAPAAAAGLDDKQAQDLKKLQFLYQVMEEVNQALASQAPINQVLLMILEGIFRGIGFDRVIFSLVNTQRTAISARFGLGAEVDSLLPLLRAHLKEEDNALALALAERKEYLLEPSRRPGDRVLMAEDFWQASGAGSSLILPLHVDQIPIGAIYVDRIKPEADITEEDRRRLHLFRDLLIIALRLGKKTKIFE